MITPEPRPEQLAEVIHPVPRSSRLFELEEDFPIVWEYDGSWYRFWLRLPWTYDVASIPRVFWTFVSPSELGYEAPAAHDWLIEKKGVTVYERWSLWNNAWLKAGVTSFTRQEVDKFFAMKMREKGIPRWKRRAAYRAVRAYGWFKKNLMRKEW